MHVGTEAPLYPFFFAEAEGKNQDQDAVDSRQNGATPQYFLEEAQPANNPVYL